MSGPNQNEGNRVNGANEGNRVNGVNEANRVNGVNEVKKKPKITVLESITPDMSVLDIAKSRSVLSWKPAFEASMPDFVEISEILSLEDKKSRWYPNKEDIFRAFEMTPLDKVRVVIIGQDPYPELGMSGLPQAMGMSFSVRKGENIPGSLNNIFKEVSSCIPGFKTPDHGDLSSWARQGVLLLNSCLTVRAGIPGSHKNIWMPFIINVIDAISKVRSNCFYVLWGASAKKMADYLKDKSMILEAAHPSPRSASNGFFGCRHFLIINKYFEKISEPLIDWNLD